MLQTSDETRCLMHRGPTYPEGSEGQDASETAHLFYTVCLSQGSVIPVSKAFATE